MADASARPCTTLVADRNGSRIALLAAHGKSARRNRHRVRAVARRSREMFPTLGAVVAFYLGGHVMNHLGQLSAWRRCLGLPPAA
jgi:hypothetical protein